MAQETVTYAQLAAWFGLQARDLSNPAGLGPLFKRLQVAAVADTRENFRTSADPDGNPWAALRRARVRGPGKPLLDTGLLRGSIASVFTDRGLTLYTNLPYAALHQYGGTITPKAGKYLAIPLTREARGRRPRSFPRRLFTYKARSGRLFLAEAVAAGKGKRAKRTLELHYLLLASVTVPRRQFLGFGERFKNRAAPIVADYFAKRIVDRPIR